MFIALVSRLLNVVVVKLVNRAIKAVISTSIV